MSRERHGSRPGGRAGRWVDDRLGVSHFTDTVLNHVFPDHWSFMFGELAMYCCVILVLTGTYLTFFFDASHTDVIYHGAYVPLRGLHMSAAFESTLRLSFDVRAGLVIRQIHHWTADLFAAVVVVHLLRIFFTGAFRKPREINWIIGVTMLILVIVNGFAGYSLPDDLLSATGLRIAYSIALSIPLAGTWLASLFFGGAYPGSAVTGRLFIIHVLLLPGLIAALMGAHLAIVWRQKHTQFPDPGRSEHNVVGSHLWPTYAAKSVGLFAGLIAVAAALGGLAQINPIWLYGPYRAGSVSTAAQPDWYMGWLEGALRVFPPWRLHVAGHTIPEVFWPGVVLPGLTFGLLYLWPFLEAKVSGDHSAHELLDRPRNRPLRTAIGVGVVTFYIVLFGAGSQDLFAQHLGVTITSVNSAFRLLLVAAPVAAAAVSWKWCHDLAAADPRTDTGQPLSVTATASDPAPPAAPSSGRATLAVAQRLTTWAVAAAGVALAILEWRQRRSKATRR
jgi:ubiquinol-cytochrome c reductase cytochrome b subunit